MKNVADVVWSSQCADIRVNDGQVSGPFFIACFHLPIVQPLQEWFHVIEGVILGSVVEHPICINLSKFLEKKSKNLETHLWGEKEVIGASQSALH